MKEKIKRIIEKLNIKKIFALAFMAFLIFVGLAMIPILTKDLSKAMQDATGLIALKDKVDEHYRGMLTTEPDQLTLQNKGTYVTLNGLMAGIMGQRQVNNCIKLKNGHLATLKKSPVDIEPVIEQMEKLYLHQTEKGKHFLFVLAPYQVSKYDPQLPTGYHEYANESADVLVAQLQEAHVPVLDLREKMYEQGMSYDEAFFKTDHHWKPQTGFWAYTEILNMLTEMNAMPPVDAMYTDADNFEFRLYEDWFLGSCGKRTGPYYAGVDDFYLIVPKFGTHMTLEIVGSDILSIGRFEDVAYGMSQITEKDYYNNNPYIGYGRGNRDLAHWRNEQAPVTKKVLMIGDSFGNVPFSLLPLCIETCDEMDMRKYKEDFGEYYNAYDPDITIVLINTLLLIQENTTYDFFPDGEG